VIVEAADILDEESEKEEEGELSSDGSFDPDLTEVEDDSESGEHDGVKDARPLRGVRARLVDIQK
jgi:hypothetical protein